MSVDKNGPEKSVKTAKKTTDFGFQRVQESEKAERVKGVFDSVAGRYDLMNDLMSFGMHRFWKRFVAEIAALRPGQRVLDLAGGTGDLGRLMASRVGPKGQVVLADINESMLQHGRDRLIDRGVVEGIHFVLADAERLPFAKNSFDCICSGVGLRNVTHKLTALKSMRGVLRPGGKLLILEFSRMAVPSLRALYDAYSFHFIPWLGRAVARDVASYRYLAESIRMHPDQEALRKLMENAGFERCSYFNLTAGVVAVHRGYRL